MRYIILQVQHDSLTVSKSIIESGTHSFWFWLSLIELILIIFLCYKLFNKKKNLTFSDLTNDNLKKSRKTDVDMSNVMDSINKSRDLYKKLSSLCHPDRFVNTFKQKIAEELFQEITLNKRNYEKLLLLKERAINELNINF
jgi:hypothetical protein